MSIRPIDQQVVVQKSADIGRTYNNEANQTTVAQQTFTQTFQKEVRQMNEQVNKSAKSEQEAIDRDGGGGNGNTARKRGGKRKNDNKNDNGDKRKAASTSLFDVTI